MFLLIRSTRIYCFLHFRRAWVSEVQCVHYLFVLVLRRSQFCHRQIKNQIVRWFCSKPERVFWSTFFLLVSHIYLPLQQFRVNRGFVYWCLFSSQSESWSRISSSFFRLRHSLYSVFQLPGWLEYSASFSWRYHHPSGLQWESLLKVSPRRSPRYLTRFCDRVCCAPCLNSFLVRWIQINLRSTDSSF